jgi:molybdate transport system regulatory protein
MAPHRPAAETASANPSANAGSGHPRSGAIALGAPLRLTLRVDVGGRATLGPGKVRLLELIAEHGSISSAGRAMGMSYRRAWLLIESLNRTFAQPLVAARPGGIGGGGAELLPMGQEIVRRYRAIETRAGAAAAADLEALRSALARDAGPTHHGPAGATREGPA